MSAFHLPGKQDAKCGKENRTPRYYSRYQVGSQGDPRLGDRLKRSWRYAEFQSVSQAIQGACTGSRLRPESWSPLPPLKHALV